LVCGAAVAVLRCIGFAAASIFGSAVNFGEAFSSESFSSPPFRFRLLFLFLFLY
jgi:hypothetical protein